jgi:hypothetical protein
LHCFENSCARNCDPNDMLPKSERNLHHRGHRVRTEFHRAGYKTTGPAQRPKPSAQSAPKPLLAFDVCSSLVWFLPRRINDHARIF